MRLNPDDNQGVRYALPYLCLGAFQYSEARKALRRLDDEDGLIVFATRAIYAHTQSDKVTFRRELAKALFTLPVLRMVFLGSNKTMATDESGYRGLQPDIESFMRYSKLTLERTSGLRKVIKDFLAEPKVIQAEAELRKHWNATRGDRGNPTSLRKIPMENWDQLLVKWIERVAA